VPIQVQVQIVFYSFTYYHTGVADEIPHSIPVHNSEDLFNFPKVAGIRIINVTAEKIYTVEK